MAPKGMQINGLRVAKARLALPGSPNQAEFAKRIGIHWVTQSNIENGKAKVSLELLEKIAAETDTTREYLLGTDEEDEEAASMPSALDPQVGMVAVLIPRAALVDAAREAHRSLA